MMVLMVGNVVLTGAFKLVAIKKPASVLSPLAGDINSLNLLVYQEIFHRGGKLS